MADRILTWHIPSFPANAPVYYLEDDYAPIVARIYAGIAPTAGDLEVDILDDGVSIFKNRAVSQQKPSVVNSEIVYNTLVGAFTVGEIITGGTSAAKGEVLKQASGVMQLKTTTAASFSIGETITGGTSGATAVIGSYFRGGTLVTYVVPAPLTSMVLNAEETETEENDFADTPMEEGSWVSLTTGGVNGAKNITVHLELEKTE